MRLITLVVQLYSLLCAVALAVYAQGTNTIPGISLVEGAVGAILVNVCLRRRRKPIGGWLLFFLVIIFLGACWFLLTALIGLVGLVGLGLSSSAESSDLKWYVFFLLASLPKALVAIFALALLRSHRWVLVQRLKLVVGVQILSDVVRLTILKSQGHSSEYAGVANIEVIFPTIFLCYLIFSKRVKRVFLTQDWQS